jgi:uncharacterized protein (DUF58 family)
MEAANSSDLFKTIRRIQFQTTHLATDILAGAYRSAFKGKGMEFEEVREYMPGDEVRSIDWNVTARMNRPFIKNFREERDLTVHLIVDVSASNRFGGHHGLKSTLIAEIGAVLAFSAIKNYDRIGLILFTDEVEEYIPPRKGTQHVLRIIRELIAFKPQGKGSNVGKALAFLGKVQRRVGICFLISDFLSEGYAHDATLIAARHDLIAIHIRDLYEKTFPKIGLATISDLETEQVALIDTNAAVVQKSFTEKAEQQFLSNKKLMKHIGAGFIEIRTDLPYIVALRKFFNNRSKILR